MKNKFSGEERAFFPSFFIFSFLLVLVWGGPFLFREALAQGTAKEGLTRYDRLAEEATLLNKRGHYDQVIKLLDPHKGDRQNDSALFFNELGIAYRRQGRLPESIRAYQQALSLDPQNPVIMNNLGYVLFLNKEYPRAVEQFQQILRFNPRFKEAHSNLALTYYHWQKYQEALDELEMVLKLDPQHKEAKKLRDEISQKLKGQK